jgi:hypothetical protein
MLQRVRPILENLGLLGLWAKLAAFLALAAYQVYITLIYAALLAVQNPATRPPGWNTKTIYGLERFLILVLGCFWLVVVIFLRGYLGDGAMQRRLWSRVFYLLLFIGAIYGVSYGVLFLLSR